MTKPAVLQWPVPRMGYASENRRSPLYTDTVQWQADTILFTVVGVVFPLFCVGGFLALLCNGIWRKIKGKSCGQTFAIAIALLLLLLMFLGLFFFIGASGIGPVPN